MTSIFLIKCTTLDENGDGELSESTYIDGYVTTEKRASIYCEKMNGPKEKRSRWSPYYEYEEIYRRY